MKTVSNMEWDDNTIMPVKDKEDFLRYIFKNKAESLMKDSVLNFVRSKWDFIAGNLSLNTWPVKFSGKKLTVRVEKSVYAQELNMYMNWIMDRMKELAIPVESIKIETGSLSSFFSSGFHNQKKKEPGSSDNKKDLTPAQMQLLSELEKRNS